MYTPGGGAHWPAEGLGQRLVDDKVEPQKSWSSERKSGLGEHSWEPDGVCILVLKAIKLAEHKSGGNVDEEEDKPPKVRPQAPQHLRVGRGRGTHHRS